MLSDLLERPVFIDRVEISFDAGHRILGHEGKCASPHGHTYRVEIFVQVRTLNQLGFGIDFGDLKTPIKNWIDSNWDHAFLVNACDYELRQAFDRIHSAKVYLLERGNPSAEVLATELFDICNHLLHLPVQSVRVWESANQYSEYAAGIAVYPQKDGSSAIIERSAT